MKTIFLSLLFVICSQLTSFSQQQERITIVSTKLIDYNNRPSTIDLVHFENLDGNYAWYSMQTPDFKTWYQVYLMNLDLTGDIYINLIQCRNQWQNYDKTFKPMFCVMKLVYLGPSSDNSSTK